MTRKVLVRAGGADEPACTPGSVTGCALETQWRAPAGGHPSRPAVAGRLERSTRRLGRAVLERLRGAVARSFSTLLRVGFTEPPGSPRALVVSYTTVSPLPTPPERRWRSVLCGTVPRVTPGCR